MAKYTAEDKKAYAEKKRNEQNALLAEAIDKLCSSEGWKRYLDVRSRFHKYSFNNIMLIAMQRPDATLVMGAGGKDGKTGWKGLNRRVKEDEFKDNSIKILGPQFIYAKNPDGSFVIKNGEKVLERMWYKTLEVYDIEQTEGEPLPEPEQEDIIGHTHDEYLLRCEQYAASFGLEVEYCAMPDRLESERDDKMVHISYDLEINGRVRALVRELAFALMGEDEDAATYTQPERLVTAESVAYLTAANIGLDTSGMSVPYIAKWGEGKDALVMLRSFATKIDGLTETLTEAIS